MNHDLFSFSSITLQTLPPTLPIATASPAQSPAQRQMSPPEGQHCGCITLEGTGFGDKKRQPNGTVSAEIAAKRNRMAIEEPGLGLGTPWIEPDVLSDCVDRHRHRARRIVSERFDVSSRTGGRADDREDEKQDRMVEQAVVLTTVHACIAVRGIYRKAKI